MSWAVILVDSVGPVITGCFKNKKTATNIAKVMNELSACAGGRLYEYFVSRVPEESNSDINEALVNLFDGEDWALRYLKTEKRLCRIPCVVNFLLTKESKSNETIV